MGNQLFKNLVTLFLNDDNIIFSDRYKENLSLIPYNMCLYIFKQRGDNNNWDTFSSKELEDAWENRSLSL